MKISKKESIWYRVIKYGLEIVGRYYSNYRGFVINNEDQLNCNRLQLRVPDLGGKDYGCQILPRKGDMVWVSFENGDMDYPVWQFASYAKNEKPKEFVNPNYYGFKTPQGTKIIINDNKEEWEILLMLSGEKEWQKINKEIFELESKLIKLGKDGDEQAALGNTLKEKLEDLSDKLDNLIDSYNEHKHSTPFGPTLVPDNITQQVTNKQNLQTLVESLDEILSEKVKLDK